MVAHPAPVSTTARVGLVGAAEMTLSQLAGEKFAASASLLPATIAPWATAS